jgi:hypothetical protein
MVGLEVEFVLVATVGANANPDAADAMLQLAMLSVCLSLFFLMIDEVWQPNTLVEQKTRKWRLRGLELMK